MFSNKISFLKLSVPIRKFLSSDPGWVKLLAPYNNLRFDKNQFIIKDDTKKDTGGRSKSKQVSTTTWNPEVGSFMLIQEDVRSIISSKIHMAYCLYLADCLRPIASLYLEKGSLKYIGYELEVLETLKDPELLCSGISEDALDSMIDDFDRLSDSDKDGIVEACIGYMQDHAIFDAGFQQFREFLHLPF